MSILNLAADCKFLTDVSMANSSYVATSPSNPWNSSDVGKTICVKGAGAHGSDLKTTIASFGNSGSVTLTDGAWQAVGPTLCHYGTDDSNAINDAIDDIRTAQGIIDLPNGYILANINATVTDCLTLRGQAWGMNGQGGTVIVPMAQNIIDLTGAAGPSLERMQISTPKAAYTPKVGILCAHQDGNYRSSCIGVQQVFVCGDFDVACLYVYGIDNSRSERMNLWNRKGTGCAAMFVAKDGDGVASDFVTLRTGVTATGGDWQHNKDEFHDHKEAGGYTTGNAVLYRRFSGSQFISCIISSSSSDGILRVEDSSPGANDGCGWLQFFQSTLYSENGTLAAHALSAQGAFTYYNNGMKVSAAAARTGSGPVTCLGPLGAIF